MCFTLPSGLSGETFPYSWQYKSCLLPGRFGRRWVCQALLGGSDVPRYEGSRPDASKTDSESHPCRTLRSRVYSRVCASKGSTELQFFLRQLHPFLHLRLLNPCRLLTAPYSVRPSSMMIKIISKSMGRALMEMPRSPLTSQANLRNKAHPIGQALLKSHSRPLPKSTCTVVLGRTYKSKPFQSLLYLSFRFGRLPKDSPPFKDESKPLTLSDIIPPPDCARAIAEASLLLRPELYLCQVDG